MDDAANGRGDQTTVAGATGSARGWSGIQLAVLAFIGFCGVLTDGRPDLPRWLQTTAAVLSVSALVLACVAVFLVASVAWPLTARGRRDPSSAGPDSRGGAGSGRLRAGVVLTFIAVAVMALATSANWWPVEPVATTDDATAAATDDAVTVVEAVDASGNRWCGRLAGGGDEGTVVLSTARGGVELVLARLVRIDPVADC